MTDVSTSHQFVVFSLGEEEYATPITRVQEIIEYTEPRSVASDLHWMRGVISLRGKILPVCDLAGRMGVYADTERNTGKIVVVEAAGDMAGIVVDEVTEVLTVEEEQLDSVPVADGELVQGIAKVGDRLVILLNLDGVFAGADLAAA